MCFSKLHIVQSHPSWPAVRHALQCRPGSFYEHPYVAWSVYEIFNNLQRHLISVVCSFTQVRCQGLHFIHIQRHGFDKGHVSSTLVQRMHFTIGDNAMTSAKLQEAIPAGRQCTQKTALTEYCRWKCMA